jgi:uncharacterized BrkB/YihY/UPF0761 family membrane protein
MELSSLTKMLKDLYARSASDEVPAMGAQLSYHLVLAFFPFLIFFGDACRLHPFNRGKSA